jgi:DNA repair protein RecO (recombination protein O)
MRNIKEQAICIRTHPYSESSQIVILFSSSHGKLRVIAKGSRRPKSKFGGGIEILSMGNLIFTPPQGQSALGTLHEFDQKELYSHLRQDLLAMNCAIFCAEVLGEFTEDYDAHDELYLAFQEALTLFDSRENLLATLVQFELNLLRESGLAPVWDRCSGCSRDIVKQLAETKKEQFYFSSRNGGVLCRDCEPALVEKCQLSRNLLQCFIQKEFGPKSRQTDLLNAHELLCYHQREILGKQTRMMTFLTSLLAQKYKQH